MDEDTAKAAEKANRIYMGHLRKIEEYLSPVFLNHLSDVTKAIVNVDKIEQSCLYLRKNFNDVVVIKMETERRAMFLMTTSKIFFRVYSVDTFDTISGQKEFQSLVDLFGAQIIQIYSREIQNIKKYATDMLKVLFTNLIADNLIGKCLDRFLSNKPKSQTDPQASNEQYSLFDIDGFTKFLIRILLSASELCSDINIRLADEFIKNYPPVMHIFLKFLQDVFACATDYPRFRLLKAVASAILSIAWNLSDKTPFVPLFVKTGYVEAAIKWLGTSLLHFTTQSGNPVISLIHNISRHKEGLRELRKNSAFQALIVWKSDIEKTNIERLKLTFGMVLIRLAKSETEQKDNEDVIRTVSTALFDRSKEAAKQSNWEYDGYHLSELLDPLQHTYANAFVVQPIMDKKTDSIQFFVELFTSVYGILLNQEADDREKLIGKSLMKILLCISNDKQGREVFNNDHAFCVLAESLAKRQKQDIAKRIWANLQTFNTTTTLQNQPKRERQPMIYINYNWANIRFCRRFITNLRTFTKIDIWVDHEKVDSSDDMWDHLADIINSATLIIILVSNAYCNSVYNHQELNYVMAKVHTRHEERSVMAVAAEDNFTFSTVLTKSMNKKKPDVSFNQDISVMALETITLSKNHSLIPGPPGNTIHSRVCTII